jgi:hypothetical protein
LCESLITTFQRKTPKLPFWKYKNENKPFWNVTVMFYNALLFALALMQYYCGDIGVFKESADETDFTAVRIF